VCCGNAPLSTDQGWAANVLSHVDAIPFPCGLRISCKHKERNTAMERAFKDRGNKSCFPPQTQSMSSPSGAGEYPMGWRRAV